MAQGLGLKRKIAKPLGKKLKKAEKVGMKTGKTLDVGGRKVGNVARKAEKVLGKVERNVEGVPLVGDIAAAGQQLSRKIGQGAAVSRTAGQQLERVSERGLAKTAGEKFQRFADEVE
jgi:hypothetical protein